MAKAYVNYDFDRFVSEVMGNELENGDFSCYDGRTIYKGYHFPTKKSAILDLIEKRQDQVYQLLDEIHEIREKYKDDLTEQQ